MDNKITKKRLNDHLEYDWYKYILLLIVSIILWQFVFTSCNANKDWEEINMFFASHSYVTEGEDKLREQVTKDIFTREGNVIRSIMFETKSPGSQGYNELLMTHGYITADILILPESTLRNNFAGFVEITDEYLDMVLPAGADRTKYEYYDNVGSEVELPPEFDKSRRYGIRVDDLLKIDETYTFNKPKEEKPDGKDDTKPEDEKKPEKFYIVLNNASTNGGKFNKKSALERDEALYAIRSILTYYPLKPIV